MKNKIGLLLAIIFCMAPASVFAIIQLIKTFQVNSPWLSILAFFCIVGTWVLVIKTFSFQDNRDTKNTSAK